MCLAIKTAPKARGIDNLITRIIKKEEIEILTQEMEKIAKSGYRSSTFLRDAKNISNADAILLVGTKIEPLRLDCGFCGFKDCDDCIDKGGRCAFNLNDLGIAIGSAVSIACDHRLDNRVMYTVGYAAVKKKLLGEDVKVALGIPLSAKGKNIFFDRI